MTIKYVIYFVLFKEPILRPIVFLLLAVFKVNIQRPLRRSMEVVYIPL